MLRLVTLHPNDWNTVSEKLATGKTAEQCEKTYQEFMQGLKNNNNTSINKEKEEKKNNDKDENEDNEENMEEQLKLEDERLLKEEEIAKENLQVSNEDSPYIKIKGDLFYFV